MEWQSSIFASKGILFDKNIWIKMLKILWGSKIEYHMRYKWKDNSRQQAKPMRFVEEVDELYDVVVSSAECEDVDFL